jgi:hypothetical protein
MEYNVGKEAPWKVARWKNQFDLHIMLSIFIYSSYI